MSPAWTYALLSVLLASLMGFAGALTLLFKNNQSHRLLLFLVSFSAGALFGDAFIHLLPEAIQPAGFTPFISLSIIAGILAFFVLEKIVCWRHCHIEISDDHPHPFAWMNLIGDGFHNFIDGMVIAGSYLAGIELGIATTIAVILHEIPQEIGDFGVLVYGGFSRVKALLLNFSAQLCSLLGALLVLSLSQKLGMLTTFLIPFTAGGFIYIAGSDLIPEMHKESRLSVSILQFASIALGVGLMFLLLLLD